MLITLNRCCYNILSKLLKQNDYNNEFVVFLYNLKLIDEVFTIITINIF